MENRSEVLKGRNVLIVDDHTLNIYALKEYLLTLDINVYEARHGNEAIEFLRLKQTPVDIVLLDMAMPEMDGFETLEAIRKEASISSIPVFAVTARAMKGDEQKCLKAGATDYVSKPVNTNELLKKMIKALIKNL